MLNIDTTTMLIELTRGDTASIVFSAVESDGTTVTPVAGDKLKFAVAKKVGAEPLFEIEHTMDSDATEFWTIVIDDEAWDKAEEALGSKMKFADYVWDCQYTVNTGEVNTIIGKTDDLSPTFRVLGEVATE